jgi:hypothetical protein
MPIGVALICGDEPMMSIAAIALERLVGPWLKVVTVPLLCLALLTVTKIAWDRRDARILQQGEMACDRRWEAEVRAQERKSAEKAFTALNEILDGERKVTDAQNEEIKTLRDRMAVLSASAPKDGSDRSSCLSPGVLDALRQPEPAGGGRPAPAPNRKRG